jgi:hypothetical protein
MAEQQSKVTTHCALAINEMCLVENEDQYQGPQRPSTTCLQVMCHILALSNSKVCVCSCLHSPLVSLRVSQQPPRRLLVLVQDTVQDKSSVWHDLGRQI